VVKFINIFTSNFCADILAPKNYKAKLYLEKSCAKHFSAKKLPKMLMKFTPLVNFINILQAAFLPKFLRQKITKPKCN